MDRIQLGKRLYLPSWPSASLMHGMQHEAVPMLSHAYHVGNQVHCAPMPELCPWIGWQDERSQPVRYSVRGKVT